MARFLVSVLVAGGLAFVACKDRDPDVSSLAAPSPTTPGPTAPSPTPLPRSPCLGPGNDSAVLIDASHDGGVWWFPQAGPFDPDEDHQGQGLAQYLRSRGYGVDEVGRDSVVTRERLLSYRIVVRAGNCGAYTADEIAAYRDFASSGFGDVASCPRTLILAGEFLRAGERDIVAEAVGFRPAGVVRGTVTGFAPHAITAGVGELYYDAGSFLVPGQLAAVQMIGWLATGEPVMGVIDREPTSRLFFIGDTNGAVLSDSQSFVDNLIAWGF